MYGRDAERLFDNSGQSKTFLRCSCCHHVMLGIVPSADPPRLICDYCDESDLDFADTY